MVSAQSWVTDSLGDGFELTYFDQGRDYSGLVRSSLVRYVRPQHSDSAVLYVHGFNDYFFQKELAEQFADHRYGFFAVDLRKYGRSLMPGQKRCQFRDVKEYYPDIDSALAVIMAEGFSHIVLMGHSTGGLIVSCYMVAHPEAPVDELVLNSPFLDWNLGKMECMVGAVRMLGAIFPSIPFSTGSSTAYGESLHADHHGRWRFNTDWKSLGGTKVDAGWVRGISRAQRYLRSHRDAIRIPILLMYSASSVNVPVWSPEVNRADAVLDVEDIRSYGLELGPDVTAIKVEGGMHDLILSDDDVRYPLYAFIFRWLATH